MTVNFYAFVIAVGSNRYNDWAHSMVP